MFTIGISEFRAKLNQVLQQVQEGEIISITIRGAEVARLVPPDFARLAAREKLESLRKTAFVGDVLSPAADEGDWEAAR
jgi:prevent-host-death family protein